MNEIFVVVILIGMGMLLKRISRIEHKTNQNNTNMPVNVLWTDIIERPTHISSFKNDCGYITSKEVSNLDCKIKLVPPTNPSPGDIWIA